MRTEPQFEERASASRRSLIGPIVIGPGALLLVILTVKQNYIGHHRSKTLEIINNLRQLDSATQQWGYEHGRTGAVLVTKEDLAPYLKHTDGWIKSVAGERYTLKPLTESPEAELTHAVEGPVS